jgi:hypothetical protein
MIEVLHAILLVLCEIRGHFDILPTNTLALNDDVRITITRPSKVTHFETGNDLVEL